MSTGLVAVTFTELAPMQTGNKIVSPTGWLTAAVGDLLIREHQLLQAMSIFVQSGQVCHQIGQKAPRNTVTPV